MARRAKPQPSTLPERTGGRLAMFRYCLREKRWSVCANILADLCERVIQNEREDSRANRSVEATRAASAEWSQLIGQLDVMLLAGCIPINGYAMCGEYENSEPGIFLDWCSSWISQRAGDVAG